MGLQTIFDIQVGDKIHYNRGVVQVLDVGSSGLLVTYIKQDNILSKNSFTITYAELMKEDDHDNAD